MSTMVPNSMRMHPLPCVVFLKQKLKFLDNLLPLLAELVGAGVIARPLIVVAHPSHLVPIRQNITLMAGIEEIGARLVALDGNPVLRRLKSVWLLRVLLARRCLAIVSADFGHFYRALVRLNRLLFGGRAVFSMLSVMPEFIDARFRLANFGWQADLGRNAPMEASFEEKHRALRHFDGVLVSDLVQVTGGPPQIWIGYPRTLKGWLAFLDRSRRRLLGPEIEEPYFLFVLQAIENPDPEQNNKMADTLVREVLSLLQPFCGRIRTVFKPHPATDMIHLRRLIEETGYTNYVISYAHPIQLIRGAKFALAYYSSTVLLDAYALGVPTIDHVRYSPGLASAAQGQSLLAPFVDFFSDHRAPERLVGHIAGLLDGTLPLQRNPKDVETFLAADSGDIARQVRALFA